MKRDQIILVAITPALMVAIMVAAAAEAAVEYVRDFKVRLRDLADR